MTAEVIDELKKIASAQDNTAAELKRMADAQERTAKAAEVLAKDIGSWVREQSFRNNIT